MVPSPKREGSWEGGGQGLLFKSLLTKSPVELLGLSHLSEAGATLPTVPISTGLISGTLTLKVWKLQMDLLELEVRVQCPQRSHESAGGI